MKKEALESSIPGSKSGKKVFIGLRPCLVFGIAACAAFAAQAEPWPRLQGLVLSHPFADVGEGEAVISSNPALLRPHASWILGFAAEQPFGLSEVWTMMAHAAWSQDIGHVGLAWRRESWLGLWQHNAYRLTLSGQSHGLAAGLAWEPSQRHWEGHEEWHGSSFTAGLAWQAGPLQAGLRTSDDVAAFGKGLEKAWKKNMDPTAALAYSWASARHADWGLWQIAVSLPLQAWQPEQAHWAARYTWGPGLRLELGWQGKAQEISLGLALPWGPWFWRPGWRQQGTLGRTLSSSLLWQS